MRRRMAIVMLIFWCLSHEVIAGDGKIDGRDIDSLSAAIHRGSTDQRFDMDEDGVVDLNDIIDSNSGWLQVAGTRNPDKTAGRAYLPGDANLDGRVDGRDFVIWNDNKGAQTSRWTRGDFNADGIVDVEDFTIWSSYKFESSKTYFPK